MQFYVIYLKEKSSLMSTLVLFNWLRLTRK